MPNPSFPSHPSQSSQTNQPGYKSLLSYKLADIAFQLGWELVPQYYKKHEDARQRDQIKQALRSFKQNIVEGSSERSLSSKLKLYDVAKASSMEALEDFEDILKFEHLSRWDRHDQRLKKLQYSIESYPSHPSNPPVLRPSMASIRKVLGGVEGKDGLESVVNYEIDVLVRGGFLLDKQINAIETRHMQEGGYRENLYKKRVEYRRRNGK